MSEPLPYHCPTLNGNFFKPPCERQIAEAKEKREKFPNAMLGFLEKCLECGGKDLMQREGATSVVKPCNTLPENRKAMIQDGQISSSVVLGGSLPEKTGNYDKKYDKAVNVIQKGDLAENVIQKPANDCDTVKHSTPPCDKNAILRQSILGAIDIFEAKGVYPTRMMLSEHLGIKVYKIDLLIKELRTRGEIEVVPDSWPNEVRKPGANDGASIITGPDLQKDAKNIHGIIHEEDPDSKDSLHTADSSTCEILQTDSSDACQNEDENRTETRTTQEDQSMAAVVKFKSQEEAEKCMGPGKIPEPEIPTCTRPDCEAPGSPVKIYKLGRSMWMCAACVSARGRRGGFGVQSEKPPASVEAMLNQAKYADLKLWLEAQAEENERTLLQEIVYRLKMSMRGKIGS